MADGAGCFMYVFPSVVLLKPILTLNLNQNVHLFFAEHTVNIATISSRMRVENKRDGPAEFRVDRVANGEMMWSVMACLPLEREPNDVYRITMSSPLSAQLWKPSFDAVQCNIFTGRYVPLMWYGDERVMDQTSAETLHQEFLIYVDFAVGTAWKGFVAFATLAVFGCVVWTIFSVLKIKHDRRVWVD